MPSGELQTKSSHPNPTGTKDELGVLIIVRMSTAEAAMNVPEDGEHREPDSSDLEGQQITLGKEDIGPDPYVDAPENKSSEFQKAVYFWVLSRF